MNDTIPKHSITWMAEQLGRDPRWVRRNLAQIPHHVVGKRARFSEKNLADYVASTAVVPATGARPAVPDGIDPLAPTKRSARAHARGGAR